MPQMKKTSGFSVSKYCCVLCLQDTIKLLGHILDSTTLQRLLIVWDHVGSERKHGMCETILGLAESHSIPESHYVIQEYVQNQLDAVELDLPCNEVQNSFGNQVWPLVAGAVLGIAAGVVTLPVLLLLFFD